ncbi:MAG: hypothetical protein ABFD04_10690 [Syntrophomonas sp.]
MLKDMDNKVLSDELLGTVQGGTEKPDKKWHASCNYPGCPWESEGVVLQSDLKQPEKDHTSKYKGHDSFNEYQDSTINGGTVNMLL